MEPNLNALRHAEMRDLLGAFALGAVDEGEATAMRTHLATCDECQAEIAELYAAVESLAASIEPMEPPAGLRERISAAVLAEAPSAPAPPVAPAAPGWPPAVAPRPEPVREPIRPPVSFWSRAAPWATAAAALLLVTLGLLFWNLQLRNELQAIPPPQVIALAPTDAAPGASGEVRYQPQSQLMVLDVRDLPPLPVGKVYEVWLIGAEGAPVPSGTFDAPTAQHAIIADRGRYTTLAITAEPGPLGTAAPTGEIVATAAL